MKRLLIWAVGLMAVGAVASASVRWPTPARIGANRSAGPFLALPASSPSTAKDERQIALGEALFSDVRLSGDGRRACVSCHDLSSNGASGQDRDQAPDGGRLAFNTPTVFNAATNFRLNWEGQFRNLEEQARRSIENRAIMAGDTRRITAAMRGDPAMVQRFRAAYGRDPNAADLVAAIARFETTLTTPGARFDRYLQGDLDALSAREQRGYRLFQSAGCSACHQGVNVGGNLYQRSGVFHPLTDSRAPVLRVPSLRNVGETAPYFHDGSAKSLEDAVRAMGRAQLNRVLTSAQVDDIAAFLRTLTGRYRERPVRSAGQ